MSNRALVSTLAGRFKCIAVPIGLVIHLGRDIFSLVGASILKLLGKSRKSCSAYLNLTFSTISQLYQSQKKLIHLKLVANAITNITHDNDTMRFDNAKRLNINLPIFVSMRETRAQLNSWMQKTSYLIIRDAQNNYELVTKLIRNDQLLDFQDGIIFWEETHIFFLGIFFYDSLIFLSL